MIMMGDLDINKRKLAHRDEVKNQETNKKAKKEDQTSNVPAASMEEKSILEGQPRVKFQVERIDDVTLPQPEEWKPLARALETSEALGAAPVCPREGFVFGNGAVLCSNGDSVIVSKSGRCAGVEFTKSQFVRVVNFDNNTWKATYGGIIKEESAAGDAQIKPSSDTPLLWNALVVAPKKFSWKLKPKFVLHGHSCASKEEADAKGFPCSTHETLFSTPEDLKALMDLFKENPYPKHQVYVRKNHGFFLLSQDEREACRIFEEKLAPSEKHKQHDD
mmetsp:Transcript_19446/g.29231  ORF Transcript_19446/g.29231 Transcript_19446/m.29231 type:complete len:276 (+) Transcript_19446:65-892(+)|eukprot:CAMPEP_0178896308 /NCGR_PEP_ID=MMETSP0786-20121207/1092_1 /TAXON_ID=186022 /ORGANISM="Thalassionema frauenfeldii, Strain CCMP 1798" /LENGTH=275 /DNA_ID=CAMNT_0020566679 /DNA_START=41 /DNA_END=868 /DNA_ORIENTATION=-